MEDSIMLAKCVKNLSHQKWICIVQILPLIMDFNTSQIHLANITVLLRKNVTGIKYLPSAILCVLAVHRYVVEFNILSASSNIP